MAHQLRWWLGATLVACGLIVAGYVPPRGVAPARTARVSAAEPTAARVRVNKLAEQWRAADLAVRLAQYRRQLEPEIARRRAADEPGAALLVDAPDTIPASTRFLLQSALDTVWRELGLGVTKVAVGVVVDFWRTGTSPAGAVPRAMREGGYLLPDSTDRSTCVALVPSWYWTQDEWTQPNQELAGRLRTALGECAFFAAYGVPGAPVRRWLARRNYDLAGLPTWSSQSSLGHEWTSVVRPDTREVWWENVYRHPVATISCLAGRSTSCRTAVLAGDSLPRLSQSDPRWWWNERLVLGRRYLGDVAREVGHDRFLRFWSSTDPVDTSLAAALKVPVGDWTERWQHRYVPQVPLGAMAPWWAMALGISLAALALVGAVMGATRREVG